MRVISLVAVCMVMTAVVAGHLFDAAATENVKQLAVVHRHGARVTQPEVNSTVICGSQCGQLTTSGGEILFSLGRWVRDKYAASVALDDLSSIPVRGNTYNPDTIFTKSTDVDRTLQSGNAFIRGLYANTTTTNDYQLFGAVMPVIHTTPIEKEHLMLPNQAWCNTFIRTYIGFDAPVMQACLTTFEKYISNETRTMLGQALNLQDTCDGNNLTSTDLVNCAFSALDEVASALSNPNGAWLSPQVAATLPNLTQVLETHNRLVFYQYKSLFPEFVEHIGLFGYPLAKDIVAQLATGTILTQYSGHDLTVLPLTAVLLYYQPNPLFGAAVVAELTDQGNIRWLFGQPNQTYDSDYAYTFTPLQFPCAKNDGNGTVYFALSCPIADFDRYLDWWAGPKWVRDAVRAGKSAPTTAVEPWCYMDTATLTAMDCIPGKSSTDAKGEAPNPICGFYRKNCPVWSCLGPHYDLSKQTAYLTPDLICKPLA